MRRSVVCRACGLITYSPAAHWEATTCRDAQTRNALIADGYVLTGFHLRLRVAFGENPPLAIVDGQVWAPKALDSIAQELCRQRFGMRAPESIGVLKNDPAYAELRQKILARLTEKAMQEE
jgi:hypothetical protein